VVTGLPVACPLHEHLRLAGLGVLDHVGQRLGHHEVGDRLDHRRRAAGHLHGQPDRDWRPGHHAGQRRVQAAVLEHGWVQPADQVPQFEQGGLGVLMGFRDGQLGLLGGRDLSAGHAQVHGQGDQALLGAVVQVPFQAAPLGVSRVHRPGSRLGQMLHLVLQLFGAARAEQPARSPGIERRDRPGKPRRGDQQHDPGAGQVRVRRDAEQPGRQAVGRCTRKLAAPEQARLREGPGVGVHQGVQHAGQPHAEHQDPARGQRRAGQEVVSELTPGGPGPDRRDDTPRA
jgi:hypothetical protein